MNIFLVLLLTFFNFDTETPTQFSQEALEDTFITLEGDTIQFKDILKKYEGKIIVVDVWASWCRDCVKGMPLVKDLQKDYPEAIYLFLSLDKNLESWKKGIKKHKIKGDHYYMQSGWKGSFGTFLNLDWIPRYMVIDANGEIKLFKAVEANDIKIKQSLN